MPPPGFETESSGSESTGCGSRDPEYSLSRSLSKLILPLLFEPVNGQF